MLFRRRPRLSPEQVLASRPMQNPALKSEPIEGGGRRLHVRRRGDWWVRVLATVFPVPRERVVELDAVGGEVWELCDGEHTLREMTRVFQERHKLTRAEAEWSLRTYLKDLGKRNLVAFAVAKSGRPGEESEGVVVGSAGEGAKEGERAHGKRG